LARALERPSRGTGASSGPEASPPPGSNRLDVTLRFRVLSDRRVVGSLGSPRPAWPRCLASIRPFRYSSSVRAQGRDSLGRSSHAVALTFTAYPEDLAFAFAQGTSRGVPFPSALGEVRVHVRPVSRFGSGALSPRSAGGSQAADYGVAHRFSQPRSDFFLTRPSCHFQTGNALGIRPSGVSSSRGSPPARRRRHTLLTLLLVECACSRPRREPPPARRVAS
jgi:hypothetical protein